MYLFAGRQRHSDIASFLRKAEKSGRFKLVLMEFDIERSPDHDLTDSSLWDKIFALLKEGDWVLIVSPPCNTFSRARFRHQQHPGPKPLRTKTWPKGFPWLSNRDRLKVDEANLFVERCLQGCDISCSAGGHFILEHPEDLGAVQGERPGSIWQWEELLELIPRLGAVCFAIHQCSFGAITPKPTRFLTDMAVNDKRCFKSLPKFDKDGLYVGPLPRDCGHVHSHKLIGKTAARWNTAPSASYPPRLCEFLANLIISCGGGSDDVACQTQGKKRKFVEVTTESTGASQAPSTTTQVESGPSVVPSVLVCDSGRDVEMQCEGKSDGHGPEQGSQVAEQFNMASCLNSGRPISVEWDGVRRGFIDGFGLCSPCRWKPSQRGTERPHEMVKLANDTFEILAECVRQNIKDVRKEAFRLVTGKLTESPFSEECLGVVRAKWMALLGDPADAAIVDEGQPFFLRALSQWLKRFEDPDASWLVDEEDSFATGVCLGVTKPLPRSPQIFPPKLKHRKLDDTEFMPIAENYSSAQMSVKELEEKFREEEALGRMHPSKLGVLREQFGDSLRVASMAAIAKPDGSVRPLDDATHSVMVNHSIVYQDKIDCPGPAEISSIVREATETREAPFCVSADIKAAHRLVKIRSCDWGYMCCRADSNSDVVWVNHTGTFGISSAPYWWAKIAGLIGRFVGYMFHQRWMMQMIYVDDLHGSFVGVVKFLNVWIWVLAYELVGTPFGYHKFKGQGDTIILTLEYIEAELKRETFMVSTRRSKTLAGEQFRTDAKCATGYVVLAGWELVSKRWFCLRLSPGEVPFLFKPDGSSQWASTSAELLATYVALRVFGWLAPGKDRKSLEVTLTAGTDNKSNEPLSSKRATTKWPLMAINMQMSSALSRARLSLGLRWRPREENTQADQLTNEDFTGFSMDKRVQVSLGDVDVSVLQKLVDTRAEFDAAREAAKELAKVATGPGKKKTDKTPGEGGGCFPHCTLLTMGLFLSSMGQNFSGHISVLQLWRMLECRVETMTLRLLWTTHSLAEELWLQLSYRTKVLTGKRLKVLLDEIGVRDDGDHAQLDVEDHNEVGVRAGNRQLRNAVRTIARFAFLMGLEPTGAMGFQQCAADGSDCGPAKEHGNDAHPMVVYVILFGWCLVMTVLMLAVSVMAWRRIRALEVDAGHLALQVAEADTIIGQHMQMIPQVNQSVAQLREQTVEHDQHLHTMTDSCTADEDV
eukprot:s72_g6.t1